MNIKKMKLIGRFMLSALVVACLLVGVMTIYSPNSDTEAAAVSAGATSVLNINQQGVNTNFLSSAMIGGQNECIYYGTKSSAAIKWRVLSANDSNYSNGDVLLFADDVLGAEQYNLNYDNINFAYWGTSRIRAALNGGYYLSNTANNTAMPTLDSEININNSWYNTLFTPNERLCIVPTKEYETKAFGERGTGKLYKVTDIVGNQSGQYDSTKVSAMNTLAQNAGVNSKVQVDGTSVIEKTTGDKLFLLDYYDINNKAYGFYDQSDGKSYAEKVNASWNANTSNWLPGYNDDGNNGTKTGNYLKASELWWLRTPGPLTADARPLVIDKTGFVGTHYGSVFTIYVRPAFNLSSSSIVYATAAAVGANGPTFAKVDGVITGTPAYKVYTKASGYKNYNDGANSFDAPKVSVAGGSVSVTKSGQNGNAVILLADKSVEGSVVYQATATFSGGTATANLPSGVDVSKYNLTVLLADSIRGGTYAESVTGSYSINMLPIPQNITPVDYNDSVQTLDDVKSTLTWYDNVFEDTDAMSVEYLDSSDNVLTQVAGNLPKNAGKYKIRFTIIDQDRYQWQDKYTDTNAYRTIEFEIKQIEITYPTINGTKKEYNGSGGVNFELKDFNSNFMDLAWKDNYTGVSMNLSSVPYSVSATTVGKYELVASIKSSQAINYKFKSTSKLEVEITPAELIVDRIVAHGSGNNTNINVSEGTATASVDIYFDINSQPKGADVVPIVIYFAYDSFTDKDVSQAINVDAVTLSSSSYQMQNQQLIDLGGLFGGSSYDLKVKSSDTNYKTTLKKTSTLTILPPGQRTNILWKLFEGSIENTKYRNVTELTDTSVKNLLSNPVYTGEQFRFEVEYPDGYTLDSEYGTGGYLVEKISGDGNVFGKDAGEYKTSIKFDGHSEIYSIQWTIDKAKFNLTDVKWVHDGKMPFSTNVNDMVAKIDKTTLPKGLDVDDNTGYTGVAQGHHAGDADTISVTFKFDASDPTYALNYELPTKGGNDTNYTFDGTSDFEWDITWTIEKLVVKVDWMPQSYNDYSRQTLKDDKRVVEYEYYLWDTANKTTIGNALSEDDIEIIENEVHYYVTKAAIKNAYVGDAEFDKTDVFSPPFAVGVMSTPVNVKLVSDKLTYNGQAQQVKLNLDVALSDSDFDFVYYDRNSLIPLSGAPTDAGDYRVEIKLKDSVSGYHLEGNNVENGADGKVAVIEFAIAKMQVKNDLWNELRNPPSLKVSAKEMHGVKHEYADMNGNALSFSDLRAGNSYKVRAIIKDKNNYVFADGTTETDWKEFTVSENEQMYDPDDPNNPYYPSDDENIGSGNIADGSGDNGGGMGSIDDIINRLKDIPLWQLIASVISIILIIIFLSKTAKYEGERKKFNKKSDKLEKSVYAGTFLGLAFSGWTAIACVLMALAVTSFIIMLLEKSRRDKAEENYEDLLSEAQQKKEENMRMMFMGMGNNGGMAQGGYVQQPAFDMNDMRGLITETVTALLPGVQQMLPAQASTNDEVVQRLVEENARSQETIQELMKKLAEQPTQTVVEREVAVSNVNDEAIKSLIEGQRIIMEKLANQSYQSQQPQVQVIEKEVPVEKIVEKVVEVPVEVEKIVEKEVKVEVPVEVEKIVEKEVPVEKIVEVPVEKVVEKIVEKEVKVAAPAKPKKEIAPRLTLDEAYALLSKQQKKYFDGLKEYALSKPNSKEKKSTYAITIGQSTVNPLLKLTIKKDMTVALFKMEDEYLKDIKRDASGDGTKIKVKETEVIISDAQACKAAKNMIDLREDQIERYQDLLKEQRALKRK